MKRPADNDVNCLKFEDLINRKTLENINCKNPINRSSLENRVTALIVARTNSKRLPRKALIKICGITAIEHLINRVKQSKKVNKIILCTTKKKQDRLLEKIAIKNNILCFRGDENNVLKRALDSVKNMKTDLIIRITGDDILVDPHYLDLTVNLHLRKNLQYTDSKKLPSGTEVEVFDYKLLKLIYNLSEDSSGTEYLTYYLDNHKHQFKVGSLNITNNYRDKIRLTLDTKKDLKVIKKFLEKMKSEKKLMNYKLKDIINFYKNNKKLFNNNKINNKRKILINTKFNWEKIIN